MLKKQLSFVVMHLAKLAMLIVLTTYLHGCSSHMFDSRTDQEIVEDRATQRWHLLIKRDFSRAYQYLSPGSRETMPENAYIRRFGTATQWLDIMPVSSDCEEGLCELVLRLHYRIQHKFFPKGIESSRKIKEKWIRSDGQWWYLVEN